MGCPDSVMVPCPKCGNREEFQSKSGPNRLLCYNLEECPEDILENVNRHSPQQCRTCGTWFEVRFIPTPTAVDPVNPEDKQIRLTKYQDYLHEQCYNNNKEDFS